MGVITTVVSKEENLYTPVNLPKPERVLPTMAQYKNLRDMFDGGGAGKSGPKFEGGGTEDKQHGTQNNDYTLGSLSTLAANPC